jgi:hypothetical protein
VRADLVDRGEVVEEAVARGAQVQPPDPHALGARDPRRLVQVRVEALGPVAQRLGVVGLEVLDVRGDEAARSSASRTTDSWSGSPSGKT